MSRNGIRVAFLAVLAAGGVFLCLAQGTRAEWTVVGSPHDFVGRAPNVAPGGSCSACHIPHGAQDKLLWVRPLGGYRSELTERDGLPSGVELNYLVANTLLCYDCHDNHTVTDFENPNVPDIDDFPLSHKPHNIMFGFSSVSKGNMSEDGIGGSVPGFFETNPVGPSGSPNYGVNLSAPLSETGGHYFKQDPTNSSTDSLKAGDKLPCSDCHDPHAWQSNGSWQVFFRKDWPTSKVADRLGVSAIPEAVASDLTANDLPTGNRNNEKSRNLCIACHGNGNAADNVDKVWAVQFRDIRTEYDHTTADNITQTPSTVTDHKSDSGVPCVSCHKHNSVYVSCSSCHSYPGQDNTSSGKQMSAGHWVHVGKPGAGGVDDSMQYGCEVCHFGYQSRHNDTNVSSGSSWPAGYVDNVSINFDSSINPANAAGPTYNGLSATGADYAKGTAAQNGACAKLYCHGGNEDENPPGTNWWGAAYPVPTWDNVGFTKGQRCGWCHGTATTTPAITQGNHAAHLDNTASNARGPGGYEKFSSSGSCSEGTGQVSCHAGNTSFPTATHANGTKNFSDAGLPNLSATTVCENCHSSASASWKDDSGSTVTKTGNTEVKANWDNNTFRVHCLTCHNKNSPASTNMGGGTPFAPNIELAWSTSGHGAYGSPVDNTSTNNTTSPVDQTLPLECSSCHDINSRHFGNDTSTGNAWRLNSGAAHDNAGGLDKFCALQCHGGTDAGTSWDCSKPGLPMDHFWLEDLCPRDPNKDSTDTHPTYKDVEIPDKTAIPNLMAANWMPLDNDIRIATGKETWFLCVTCHDPHGTGNFVAGSWGRSFQGQNGMSLQDLHMLRYEYTSTLCRKCHI